MSSRRAKAMLQLAMTTTTEESTETVPSPSKHHKLSSPNTRLKETRTPPSVDDAKRETIKDHDHHSINPRRPIPTLFSHMPSSASVLISPSTGPSSLSTTTMYSTPSSSSSLSATTVSHRTTQRLTSSTTSILPTHTTRTSIVSTERIHDPSEGENDLSSIIVTSNDNTGRPYTRRRRRLTTIEEDHGDDDGNHNTNTNIPSSDQRTVPNSPEQYNTTKNTSSSPSTHQPTSPSPRRRTPRLHHSNHPSSPPNASSTIARALGIATPMMNALSPLHTESIPNENNATTGKRNTTSNKLARQLQFLPSTSTTVTDDRTENKEDATTTLRPNTYTLTNTPQTTNHTIRIPPLTSPGQFPVSPSSPTGPTSGMLALRKGNPPAVKRVRKTETRITDDEWNNFYAHGKNDDTTSIDTYNSRSSFNSCSNHHHHTTTTNTSLHTNNTHPSSHSGTGFGYESNDSTGDHPNTVMDTSLPVPPSTIRTRSQQRTKLTTDMAIHASSDSSVHDNHTVPASPLRSHEYLHTSLHNLSPRSNISETTASVASSTPRKPRIARTLFRQTIPSSNSRYDTNMDLFTDSEKIIRERQRRSNSQDEDNDTGSVYSSAGDRVRGFGIRSSNSVVSGASSVVSFDQRSSLTIDTDKSDNNSINSSSLRHGRHSHQHPHLSSPYRLKGGNGNTHRPSPNTLTGARFILRSPNSTNNVANGSTNTSTATTNLTSPMVARVAGLAGSPRAQALQRQATTLNQLSPTHGTTTGTSTMASSLTPSAHSLRRSPRRITPIHADTLVTVSSSATLTMVPSEVPQNTTTTANNTTPNRMRSIMNDTTPKISLENMMNHHPDHLVSSLSTEDEEEGEDEEVVVVYLNENEVIDNQGRILYLSSDTSPSFVTNSSTNGSVVSSSSLFSGTSNGEYFMEPNDTDLTVRTRRQRAQETLHLNSHNPSAKIARLSESGRRVRVTFAVSPRPSPSSAMGSSIHSGSANSIQPLSLFTSSTVTNTTSDTNSSSSGNKGKSFGTFTNHGNYSNTGTSFPIPSLQLTDPSSNPSSTNALYQPSPLPTPLSSTIVPSSLLSLPQYLRNISTYLNDFPPLSSKYNELFTIMQALDNVITLFHRKGKVRLAHSWINTVTGSNHSTAGKDEEVVLSNDNNNTNISSQQRTSRSSGSTLTSNLNLPLITIDSLSAGMASATGRQFTPTLLSQIEALVPGAFIIGLARVGQHNECLDNISDIIYYNQPITNRLIGKIQDMIKINNTANSSSNTKYTFSSSSSSSSAFTQGTWKLVLDINPLWPDTSYVLSLAHKNTGILPLPVLGIDTLQTFLQKNTVTNLNNSSHSKGYGLSSSSSSSIAVPSHDLLLDDSSENTRDSHVSRSSLTLSEASSHSTTVINSSPGRTVTSVGSTSARSSTSDQTGRLSMNPISSRRNSEDSNTTPTNITNSTSTVSSGSVSTVVTPLSLENRRDAFYYALYTHILQGHTQFAQENRIMLDDTYDYTGKGRWISEHFDPDTYVMIPSVTLPSVQLLHDMIINMQPSQGNPTTTTTLSSSASLLDDEDLHISPRRKGIFGDGHPTHSSMNNDAPPTVTETMLQDLIKKDPELAKIPRHVLLRIATTELSRNTLKQSTNHALKTTNSLSNLSLLSRIFDGIHGWMITPPKQTKIYVKDLLVRIRKHLETIGSPGEDEIRKAVDILVNTLATDYCSIVTINKQEIFKLSPLAIQGTVTSTMIRQRINDYIQHQGDITKVRMESTDNGRSKSGNSSSHGTHDVLLRSTHRR